MKFSDLETAQDLIETHQMLKDLAGVNAIMLTPNGGFSKTKKVLWVESNEEGEELFFASVKKAIEDEIKRTETRLTDLGIELDK